MILNDYLETLEQSDEETSTVSLDAHISPEWVNRGAVVTGAKVGGTAKALMQELQRQGVRLCVNDGRLWVKSQMSIPPALSAAIDRQKDQLAALSVASETADNNTLGVGSNPPAHEPSAAPNRAVFLCPECGGRKSYLWFRELHCMACHPLPDPERVREIKEAAAAMEDHPDPPGWTPEDATLAMWGDDPTWIYHHLRYHGVVFGEKKDRLMWNLLGNDVPLDDVRILVKAHAPAFKELWRQELAAAGRIERWNAGITAQAGEAKERAQAKEDDQTMKRAKPKVTDLAA